MTSSAPKAEADTSVVRRAIGAVDVMLRNWLRRSAWLSLAGGDNLALAKYLARPWVVGAISIAFLTWVGVELDLDRPGAAALAYLTLIALLSVMGSLVTSAFFSLIAVGSLDYFFVEPRYSFAVGSYQDFITLIAFVLTSLGISTWVWRARQSAATQREQARLLDLTPDAIFVLDVDRVITYWNRGAEELYGWKKQDAVGHVKHQLLKTVFPSPLEEILETLRSTGRWEGELVHTRRDGAKVTVASRWSLQRDAQGNPIGALETNTDITERKRAEETLQRSQAAYLAEAQRLSQTGSFGWNVSTGEFVWSGETFRIFGYDASTTPTLEMILGRVHPDDVAVVRRTIERAASDNEELDFEHRLLMPDGSIKTLHVVGHPMSDQPGQRQFVGAVMDVTARTAAYVALELTEQRYRRLFKHMPISLLQVDARGLLELLQGVVDAGVTDFPAYLEAHPEFVQRAIEVMVVEEVNDVTVQMFGAQDRRELLGPATRFWQARPDTIRRTLESRFRGEQTYEEKSQINTLDGRVIDVLFTATQTDAGLTIVGLVDLTDLVCAQETLQQLQAEFAHAARVSVLGELTASIAHEINQPLASIATGAAAGSRWLDRPVPELLEVRASLDDIRVDAQRASDIIARIRSMSAPRAPDRAPISLGEVICEALQFLRHEAQSRGVTVSHQLAPVAPTVLGDHTQLQQVIVNLAINAMQAMAQAGTANPKITVRTATPDATTVRCTIEDNGPGIAPEHLPRLFESFFTTKEGGMGMGLAICRSIIEAHGGRISADNDSVHGGARFAFVLPTDDTNA